MATAPPNTPFTLGTTSTAQSQVSSLPKSPLGRGGACTKSGLGMGGLLGASAAMAQGNALPHGALHVCDTMNAPGGKAIF
jgi:hypothetical protein